MRPFMSDEAEKRCDEMGRGGETRGDGMRKEKKRNQKNVWSPEYEEHCANLTLRIWKEETRWGSKRQRKMR